MPRSPVVSAVPLLASALLGCHETYSQDPKVALAYAAAAGSIAVAQAAAASHSSDPSSVDWAPSSARALTSYRDYAIRAINRVRAENALAPLTPSAPLSEFAQRGSEWLEKDHWPRRHLASDARCARCKENQGKAQGESAAPVEVQIDTALRRMMNDEELRGNLLSASARFVGVGVVGAGSAMYLTIDFAEVAF